MICNALLAFLFRVRIVPCVQSEIDQFPPHSHTSILLTFTPASSSLSKSVTRMWKKVWFTCEWKCDSHVKVSATRIWKIAPNSAVCVYSEIDQLHHMANHHACSPFGASKSYNIRSTLMLGVSNSRSLVIVLGLTVFIPPFGYRLWSYSNHIL